jgi:hypothetical protein
MEVHLVLGTQRLLEPVSRTTLNYTRHRLTTVTLGRLLATHRLRRRAKGDIRKVLRVHKVYTRVNSKERAGSALC